ncbi:hypothetical protein QQ045_016786 [Rhodiola kirilowii]
MKKLTRLFRSSRCQVKKHTWGHWHSSCNHPNAISFKLTEDDDMFKTVNSVYLEISDDGINDITPPDQSGCFFTNSNSCQSTSASPDYSDDESLETVISRVVKSDRLIFEPHQTNFILPDNYNDDRNDQVPFKESVALAMESENLYADFRRSMEEIVECHGLQEWRHLEQLLEWYLKVNRKETHRFIIGAFVDLLSISLKNNPTSTYYSSAASSISSPSSFSCSFQDEKGDHP